MQTAPHIVKLEDAIIAMLFFLSEAGLAVMPMSMEKKNLLPAQRDPVQRLRVDVLAHLRAEEDEVHVG